MHYALHTLVYDLPGPVAIQWVMQRIMHGHLHTRMGYPLNVQRHSPIGDRELKYIASGFKQITVGENGQLYAINTHDRLLVRIGYKIHAYRYMI